MDSLLEAARTLLEENTEEVVYGERVWRYSVPSRAVYPHQWLWDSCFHARIWSLFDLERACDELRSILRWQHEDGSIPHIVFWRPEPLRQHLRHWLESAEPLSLGQKRPMTTTLIQPPILAATVERLVQAGAETFLGETLPVLERFYRYLADRRDPDQDGLISTSSPYETGLDYSPAYDRLMGVDPDRPRSIKPKWRRLNARNRLAGYDLERIFASERHCEDVLVNTIWIDNLGALSRLARLAEKTELESWARAKREQALQSLLERSWDAARGLFLNLDGREERPTEVKTIQCLMPLLIDDLPAKTAERLLAHLTDPKEFWAPYPVPSVALDEPSYDEDSDLEGIHLIWRGPLSMNTNWFLWHGLLRRGETRLAAHLAERSLECVERGGFNEFFTARGGEPAGAERFGWATLAVEMSQIA